MPFGPGKQYASNGLLSRLLGNWQANGIFSAYAGTPFSVSASSASLNAPGNSQTADQVIAELDAGADARDIHERVNSAEPLQAL
jgi:hypothetical protein